MYRSTVTPSRESGKRYFHWHYTIFSDGVVEMLCTLRSIGKFLTHRHPAFAFDDSDANSAILRIQDVLPMPRRSHQSPVRLFNGPRHRKIFTDIMIRNTLRSDKLGRGTIFR